MAECRGLRFSGSLLVRPFLPRLIAPGLLLLAVPTGAPALAQSPPPPPPAARQAPSARPAGVPTEGPATQKDLYAYALIGAVTTCELTTKLKVPLQQALPASAQSVAFVVSRQHGGRVQGIDKPLTPQQLFDGSAVQITMLVRQGCYNQLNANDKKLIDTSISQIRSARGGAGQSR